MNVVGFSQEDLASVHKEEFFMDFGVIVPQGWRLDLVGISDPGEAYETMTRRRARSRCIGLSLHLALRPLPHGSHSHAGDHL